MKRFSQNIYSLGLGVSAVPESSFCLWNAYGTKTIWSQKKIRRRTDHVTGRWNTSPKTRLRARRAGNDSLRNARHSLRTQTRQRVYQPSCLLASRGDGLFGFFSLLLLCSVRDDTNGWWVVGAGVGRQYISRRFVRVRVATVCVENVAFYPRFTLLSVLKTVKGSPGYGWKTVSQKSSRYRLWIRFRLEKIQVQFIKKKYKIKIL